MPEDLDEILRSDSMGESARREKKSLLIASVCAYAVSTAGLVPSKISALGIEASQIDRRAFLLIVAMIVLYFLVFFLLYSIPDFLAWWSRYSLWQFGQEQHSRSLDIEEFHNPGIQYDPPDPPGFPSASQSYVVAQDRYYRSINRFRRAVINRLCFDMAVPAIAGIAALIHIIYSVVKG